MRVTAGIYKGRVLKENKYEHIRPTADVVKQALFNKLFGKIEEAKVLDLFCGTGALGIEAISRGAKKVVFADKDYRSISLTQENLDNLGIKAKIIKASYDKVIEKLKGEQFDVIIIDPPYKSGIYEDVIKLIAENDLLAEDGIIVCEHEKKDKFDYSPYNVIDEKRYGIKMLTYLEK